MAFFFSKDFIITELSILYLQYISWVHLRIRLCFGLFEAIQTLEVTGVSGRKRQTGDGGAAHTAGPVPGYFWFVTTCPI